MGDRDKPLPPLDMKVLGPPEYIEVDTNSQQSVLPGSHLREKNAEAVELYGDIQAAQDFGYVQRGLKSRHVQFIALGGTIGTGLFLGIGSAFVKAGPLSVLLGYTFTGIGVFAMMQCLGEMSTWLPLPGAIPQFCARYVDPAMGFAVGWNNWYACCITLCAEISAAAIVIGYWDHEITPAAWITLLIVLVVALNIFAVSIYGEAEFIFASIKILTIIGLLIMALVIDLGGGPKKDRLGFRYWKNPGAMKQYKATGDTGRFLGLFSVLINAAFSYGGVEMVAVAAGEAENPRRNIPKAVRRVFWRILFFYVLGSLALGVIVSSDDKGLLNASQKGAHDAAASPWVIAIQRAEIPVLNHIINAVILTSASSSANAFLFTGSRYLFALAQNHQAPKIFLKCTRTGVPIYAVSITAAMSGLTYLSVSSGSSSAFEWFQNLTTVAGLFTWTSVCVAYLRFHAAMKAQGVDRNTLVFKSFWQPYTAWFALVFFGIVIVFNGFAVFIHGSWNTQKFIVAYANILIYFGLFFAWKLIKRTRFVKADEADIFTGKAALDAEYWPEVVAKNWLQKMSSVPKAILFDIGGVVVTSPFSAILSYEQSNSLPAGYINFAIASSVPNGAWPRLECGALELNEGFFQAFRADLESQLIWRSYVTADPTRSQTFDPAKPASINARLLFWATMHAAQRPQPDIYLALRALRESGQFILGAVSNTVPFPVGHELAVDRLGLRDGKLFDFFVSSCEVGVRKPDDQIYDLAMRDVRKVAEERGWSVGEADVAYLDDIGANLKVPRRRGWRTCRVELGKEEAAVKTMEKWTNLDLRAGKRSSKI
ncbi:MAG: hypothetical protein M1814_005478 [Vezdaea aestivalis]|nr:MAG: hypothetical protein M1814_005478 [Vezdaea aestivalis]